VIGSESQYPRRARPRFIPGDRSHLSLLGRATKTVLPAIWLFLAGLWPQQDLYASPDYGLSVLALLGTAGCIGYAWAFLSRYRLSAFGATTLPAWPSSSTVVASGNPGRGEVWLLLVALLFSPLTILFSGLGGWVEARSITRGAYRATPALSPA
jgi:hypothetical protein